MWWSTQVGGSILVTARIRRMREGNIFSLFTPRWGVPISIPKLFHWSHDLSGRGTSSPFHNTSTGPMSFLGRYPISIPQYFNWSHVLSWEVSHLHPIILSLVPGPFWGITHPGLDGGIPLSMTGWGSPLIPIQDRTGWATGYGMGGTPLAISRRRTFLFC